MKGFSFSLETLLRHRGNIEEREKTILSRIRFNLQNEQLRREQVVRKHLEALGELEALRRVNSEQDEIRLYYPYLERLRREADAIDGNIVRLEKELQEQKNAVLAASRNKKVIETLKARKRTEFMTELNRQDQKTVDEIVVSRLGRRQD